MKLIVEYQTPQVQIEEDTESGQRDYYLEGVFLQSSKKNRNGRVYPKKVLENEVSRYMNEFVAQGRALGELGHPDSPSINLDRVSHKIVELQESGNDFVGKAKLLDTPNGQIAKNFVDNEIKIGVSSRGLGSLKKENGSNVVQDDFQLVTAADIVHDPSAPDAFVNGIMEGVEWIYESGMLKKKDIESQIENSKQNINKAHKKYKFNRRALEEAKEKELQRFLDNLLNS